MLGRRVVKSLHDRGIEASISPRDLSLVDLSSVSAVVLCATDARQSKKVDVAQVEFFATHTDAHLVYPSIVGCDAMPWPYYEAKTECESILASCGNRWTILRATQFHQLIWGWYTRPGKWPWLLVPAETRYQVLDPGLVATMLTEAVVRGATGRLPDIGGPFAYEAKELARSCQRAIEGRRLVVTYNKGGLFGASLRAGANLTPNRGAGETWNEFLDRQMRARAG